MSASGDTGLFFSPFHHRQVVEYFTKYIDAFAEYDFSINGMTLMNEPLNYQGQYDDYEL